MRYVYAFLGRMLVLALVCGPAFASTLTVTNTNDSGANSLRGTLAAASAGDTIVFAAGVTGTIALASTLSITQPVTIQGPGAASLVLDGQTTVQVMSISAAGNLNLSGVTIANGKTATLGGGVLNAGTLTVSNSIFTGNSAGNGGGISNAAGGQLSVDACTFQNNSAASVGGGAIITFSTATISNSTFTGNTAPLNGAAINVQPTGTLTLTNSTLSGNSSNGPGGAVSNLGTASIFDSTLAGNHASAGAGIATGSANVTIDNSVFADNVATGTPGAISGSVTANYNVFYNNTASGTADDLAGYGTSNFIAATAEPLAALANNGGPTQTMMPVAGSAALCAGSIALLPSGLTRDQRGSPRTTGSCLDAGSVQASQPATHFTVSAPASATAGTAFNFTVTALDASNNTALGYAGTVHFSGTDGQAVLPADATLTNGIGTFSATLKTVGNQTITATDTTTSSITGTSSTIVVSGGAATHFTVSAPASATAGTAFNFTVTALDQFNNIATGYAGTVHFSGTDGQAVLPADAALTNGAGTFSATLKTTGNQTITATDTVTSSITGTSNSIAVGAIAQTITFTSAPPVNPVVGGSYTVTAAGGGSGNPVVFSVDAASTAGACSISASTVSFAKAGTCIIDANQAGGGSYAAAAQAQQIVRIGTPVVAAPVLGRWGLLLLGLLFGAIGLTRGIVRDGR